MTFGDGPAPGATVPEAPAPPAAVKTTSLLTTLGAGGVIAGVLLVVVYSLTLPAIEANKQKDLEAAIKEVLKGAERYDALYVVKGALVAAAPDGADPKKLEQVYLGYRTGNERIGFAFVASEPGFQDLVKLIFGYDVAKKQLLGMKVLESKETPGLGDKIAKDQTFVGQFLGAATPLVGVKQGKRSKPGEVDMITGATISSKAVIRIINNTLKRLGPAVEAYAAEGTR